LAGPGAAYSDKQLPFYKDGRKSIKVDNKIAIEFLWLFIAAAYTLVYLCKSYPILQQ
jgi:hypothetical protein